MSKTLTAARITKLRESLLAAALRLVYTPCSTDEQRQEVAERACMLAHTIAVTAVAFEAEAKRAVAAERVQQKVQKKTAKRYKRNVERYKQHLESESSDDILATFK